MDDQYVLCPLVDEEIEDIECIENREIADGNLIESCLPDRFKQKKSLREICKKCKWHNY